MTVRTMKLGPAALELTLGGTLDKQGYQEFRALAEDQIEQHGEIDLLVRAKDFSGWTPAGLWEDLEFDAAHFDDVTRLALVGEDASEEWMATVSRPFTGADVEYFTEQDLGTARAWIQGAPTANPGAP